MITCCLRQLLGSDVIPVSLVYIPFLGLKYFSFLRSTDVSSIYVYTYTSIFHIKILKLYILPTQRITLAARSKARNVFVRSNTGIVGSNCTRGIHVCLRLLCLCCPV
jgi:hypothetical protein